jgi:hypothetical protein
LQRVPMASQGSTMSAQTAGFMSCKMLRFLQQRLRRATVTY